MKRNIAQDARHQQSFVTTEAEKLEWFVKSWLLAITWHWKNFKTP